jgi:hypothetical protein
MSWDSTTVNDGSRALSADEREAVTAVHETIEDGTGEGGFAEVGVPLLDRQLAQDRGGLLAGTIRRGLPAGERGPGRWSE